MKEKYRRGEESGFTEHQKENLLRVLSYSTLCVGHENNGIKSLLAKGTWRRQREGERKSGRHGCVCVCVVLYTYICTVTFERRGSIVMRQALDGWQV